MKETYEEAITRVFQDEGGYSNDAGDPGGPTNWGITIEDARLYWKPNATATDVRNMPKSVAEDIMRKHYAVPIHYDDLPSGVDYAVMDYGVNSGVSRAVKVLQKLVGVPIDGIVGPGTLQAVYAHDQKELVNAIYDERMAFLRSLGTWRLFGRGWTARLKGGRPFALQLVDKYPWSRPLDHIAAPASVVVATTAAAVAYPHHWYWIIGGGVALLALALYYYRKHYVAKSKTVAA